VTSAGSKGATFRTDVLVIGGGFFGCALALHSSMAGRRVTVVERGSALLGRASTQNQGRVHAGYHYPRSILTALRSRVNSARFERDYAEAIIAPQASYYAVARHYSNVTAVQFQAACERAGAELRPAGADVRALFDLDRIEQVFAVQESLFDVSKLASVMARRLEAAGVSCLFGAIAERISDATSGLAVTLAPSRPQATEATRVIHADQVFNCTYSSLNELLWASGLPLIPLKHELAELALVRVPAVQRRLALTVMCGPFFSVTPFASRGLHALSHVRYTPQAEWHDEAGRPVRSSGAVLGSGGHRSAARAMIQDAARYVPSMAACEHVDSLWEVKTVLPRNENDDGRPILIRQNHGIAGLTCVVGAKIDNIYDVLAELECPRGEVGAAPNTQIPAPDARAYGQL
jgi:glycine/D-amino acid oxidase-like deaminating enzyme